LLSALSGVSVQEALALGVARCDAALLAWRRALFGERWNAFAQCPQCGEMLEYELPVSGAAWTAPEDGIEVQAGERSWKVRWPDSRDLAAAATCRTRDAARAELLRRILPQEIVTAEIAESILSAIAGHHRACWRMELKCCACPNTWTVVFDAGEFLWREIRAAGRRILREVDAIARVYHWSEAEILAMSQGRRNIYLEMVE
jgi:hypothetical protein